MRLATSDRTANRASAKFGAPGRRIGESHHYRPAYVSRVRRVLSAFLDGTAARDVLSVSVPVLFHERG